jgi:chromosome segregation ATPase
VRPRGRTAGAVARGRRYSAESVDDDSGEAKGFRERMTRQGEEAIGKLAQELLENPVVTGALSAAMETRERAMRAQELALSALNLPSASDLERLTRRLRSVSQRLEAIEDSMDRIEQKLSRLDTHLDERVPAAPSKPAPK